ncbi:hypothetical protein AVEN_108710-1 [Araneus ventricosus]|uniref:Uncharacterized protein n=1 Tax=Araneus ventricosus TaxID=182803 RepID=A0A4Y2G3X2_ARAVE|nr:hypothetical protein AVEN_108710-1 [Araneus ventricosus]
MVLSSEFCRYQSNLDLKWKKRRRLRGGLEVTSWDQRAPSSKPDSKEDLPRMWACCTLNLTSLVKGPSTGVVRKFGEGGASSFDALVI